MNRRNNRESGMTSDDAKSVQRFEVRFARLTPHQLRDLKESLLNLVCTALIQQPRMSVTDPTIMKITNLSKQIAFYDPEFVLKLALYVRLDLNIRSTANYLLAVASNIKECQPYVRKYFGATIRLPSDWLDVAATYLILPDKNLKGKSLPTCLRKSMDAKFGDFDAYQLGKYNKERTIKRKLKKIKEEQAKGNAKAAKPEKPMITLKQMIRQLHISSPNYQVMCLLGKKYPMTEQEFRVSGLPGNFDPEKAGQRMKLPTPETWETLLSEKGNKAATWEELIEHKKLPFMAMLRNLRNLIYTGVHPRYHRWVQNKLSNKQTVAQSKQFPTAFFSAYEVIPRDMEHFKQLLAGQNDEKKPKKDTDGKEQVRRKRKKPIVPAHMPTNQIFDDYRRALDQAVKHATTCNVNPIRGSTVVFCNVSSETREASPGARGMGTSVRSIQEVGYLLGLMCKYVCEDCDFRVWSSPSGTVTTSHLPVQLIEGSILDNMSVVAEVASKLGEKPGDFPFDYLEEMIRDKRRVDNFLVLSHHVINPAGGGGSNTRLANLLNKYRQEVNPDLLFVSVDLSGSGKAAIGQDEKHSNDIQITGFSDQILRFIAERGDTNQLQYVEHIDEAKRLNKQTTQATWDTSPWWRWLDTFEEAPIHYPNITTGPQWREARIFISSTFLDMHGERDVLTRIVLPEVKERAKQRRIRIYEVDLRWGVTEEEAQSGKSIQLCLDEVAKCDFFIGMLGERYGWAPLEYEVPDHERFNWLKAYPKGRSITELEMNLAMETNAREKTFFYLRDHTSFISQVPEAHRKFFDPSSPEDRQKIQDLKTRIRQAKFPLLDYYPCSYGGTENGEGVVAVKDLTLFSEQVFHDLVGAIEDTFTLEALPTDSLALERTYHQAFVQQQLENFVGRKEVLAQMRKFVEGYHHQLLVITGNPGDGKSSLLANFAVDYAQKNPTTFVLPHFVGASPSSSDIRSVLHRLCLELKQVFSLQETIPEDFKDLCTTFSSMLESASFKGKLVLVIDAVNQLDEKVERAHYMEWLPAKLPCKVILSTLVGSKVLDSLKHPRYRSIISEIPLPALEVKERQELVRTTLWKYHKKLDEKPMNTQMRVLLRKADAGNPLYLTVACEELRVFGVYERVSDRIKKMSDKLPRLFEEVLKRLENDHGMTLVQDACSLVITSRGGLLENELVRLLGLEPHDIKWTSFLRSLSPFLKPAGDLGEITFFHDAFKLAVQKRYVTNTRTKVKYDGMIADYFLSSIDPASNGKWDGCSDLHAVSELPHHLVEAEKWTDLHRVLCSISFIEMKTMHGMINGLISDYNEATKSGLKYPGLQDVKEFREFVKSCAHVITKNPSLAFQQAANQPSSTAPSKKAFQLWAERDDHFKDVSWIEWTNKPEESDACKMTYSGFTEGVTTTAFSPRDNLIACATRDCTIRIFDGESGSEIATLVGHSSWIPSLTFSSDGSLLASAGWDSLVILWDVRDAKEVSRFTSHSRRVNDVAFSSDSTMLASAGWDTEVKIWLTNGETREKYSVSCGDRPLNSVAWGPEDKKLIVGTWDGTIKVISMDYEEEGKILATLTGGHKKSIQSVAYSPSGKHLVSGSMDHELLLWDAQAGKLISSLSKHSKPVTSVAYTVDGSHLLSASADATVKVWDANLGTEKDQWKLDSGWMNCCSYHPLDDSVLASGSSECYAVIWDTTNHIVKHQLDFHARPVTCIEFSPDGRFLATASEDGTLALWDPESGTLYSQLEGHSANITGLSWSADSSRLVTSSDDFTIAIWDASSGRKVNTLKGHDSAVRSVCFDPKGKMLVSASRDNTLRVWDSRNGNQVSVLRGHTDWITSCAFNPAGNRIVSCAWDNTVRLWNPRRTEPIATMEGHDSSVAFVRFTKDGKNIISCGYDNVIKIWDSESATEITTLVGHKERVNGFSQNTEGLIASVSDDTTIRIWDPLAATEVRTLVGHAAPIRSAAFHPHSKTLITASDDKTMKYWDIGLMKEEDGGWGGSSWGGAEEEEVDHKPISGHSACINHLALAPSGSSLLSVGDDKKCYLWDTETSHVTRTFRLEGSPTFKCCAFSPTEQTFVTATDDGAVWLWDVRTARHVKLACEHGGPATSCALSKDGATVVSGGWDNNVFISDLRTGSARALSGHTDWILSTAHAPTGDICASAGWDHTVRVWAASSFSRKHVLTGHMDTVTSIAISPDSRYLASGSYDSTVKLWNLTSGLVEATFPGHQGHVNKVAFSPSSPTILFSAGEDGVVKLWDVAKKEFKNEFMCRGPATACDVVVRQGELFMVFGDAIGTIYNAKLRTARRSQI